MIVRDLNEILKSQPDRVVSGRPMEQHPHALGE